MSKTSIQHTNHLARVRRTRTKLAQNQEVPRLSVHRTLRHIYVQVIDDLAGKTLASASDLSVKASGKKTEVASKVGAEIAKLALTHNVTTVRFDRGGHKYHGRIAALAEAARQNGLTF